MIKLPYVLVTLTLLSGCAVFKQNVDTPCKGTIDQCREFNEAYRYCTGAGFKEGSEDYSACMLTHASDAVLIQ